MNETVDLGAYLARVGWTDPAPPTLETLSGLHAAHMRAIPFENLDVLLSRPIRIDLAGVQDKLVRRKRGGYCFEHTTLFAAVIEALGFRPVCHSARVVLFAPREKEARLHMFLTVPLPEGRFVADPGFGGPGGLHPLPLIDSGAEGDGKALHWLTRSGDYWVLRNRLSGAASEAWVSTLEPDHEADFRVGNHFVATHPQSPFVNNLMMSLFTKDGRITVWNRNVTFIDASGPRTTQFEDRTALRNFLANQFGFDLPEAERLVVPAIPEWT